jgi:signal transduction histidine kinase
MKPEVVFGLENATWPTLLVNTAGAATWANAAAKNVFGAALAVAPAQLASIWAPENGGGATEFVSLWLRSPAAVSTLKFKTAGGATATFSTAICQFNHGGEPSLVLQLLSGVSGAEAVPEARSATEGDAALKQKLECVLQLARTVSLDFNNALTGVLAHTSLLLGKAEANHPWRRSLLEVEKSAARAAEIASELALFSRQEKEARRVPAGNVNALVSRCVDVLKSAKGPRYNWNVSLERSLFESRFEEAKVQQALTKILENAVESFSSAAMSVQISVTTRNVELTQDTQDRNVRLAAGAYVCVEISDTGAGIEPEALPRIFEPFFTTKKAPHRGLGLALVYGIISNHGGGVAISSQPGKGTSARVYLPAEKSRIHVSSGSDNNLRGTATILVVDDESLLLTMAETILADFGYKVLTASNGQKALHILGEKTHPVDLIITDLVMPGMGGRELIERIRQHGMTVPVMCTSGYVLPEDKQTGAGYLQKPFTSSELLMKVKAALELHNGN